MSQKVTFPEDFWWGAAMSGPQMEGTFEKPHENVMDYWYKTSKEEFFNGVGPTVATDFFHHYKEDIKMMKSIGMNSFRTSIQWSRLIKDLETGEPDENAVKFYQDVIDECKKNDIILVLNLHHFDLPIELFQKYGGWESKHVVDLYAKFAKTAFELFGDQVHYWTTFNEPMVIPEAGYLCGFHYPKYVNKGKDAFYNRSFLEPAVHGVFPQEMIDIMKENDVLWDQNEEELEIIKNNTIDFLGVNYYHPKRVKTRTTPLDCDYWSPEQYYEEYDMPGKRVNPYRGWEIYPKAIYDIAKNVQENYNNIPWFISENGMGVEGEERYINEEGKIEDDYRIDFYEEHLQLLAKAMEEGSNCFGYHAWTGIDCWSWNNAYKNRYGFIALDLETQKRTVKKSGEWLKKVTEEHGYIAKDSYQ